MGVEQLAMIKSYGLLLTPEEFRIPKDPRATMPEGEFPQEDFLQTRACFTLVERHELLKANGTHAKLFGDFAIGLKPSYARRLGAVPVFYMYDVFGGRTQGDVGDINLTLEILFNLRALRSICIALARLEAKAMIPNRDTLSIEMLDEIGHDLKGDPIVKRRLEHVDRRKAREVVDLLDTDRGPAWSLVDLIDITLNLFQTVDSKEQKSGTPPTPHEYYRQREWRIVQLFNPRLRCQRLDWKLATLDGAEAMLCCERWRLRKELTEFNPNFFDGHRLNGSAILRGTRDCGSRRARDFFEFVVEIICPEGVASDVKKLDDRDEFERRPSGMLRKLINSIRRVFGKSVEPVVFVRRRCQ